MIDQALLYIQQRIQNGGGQKQAIVLDIQRSLGDVLGDPAEYKTAKRAEIESLGYTIIANIGNNESDLKNERRSLQRRDRTHAYGGRRSSSRPPTAIAARNGS
ncbi:HAD family acid phosphatase [Streptomyces indonesiensis]